MSADGGNPDATAADAPEESRVQQAIEALAATGVGDFSSAEMHTAFRRLTELTQRSTFIGPLPPPEIIEGYETAHPGAAGIIFNELTQQGEHRRSLEKTAVTSQERRTNRGQWMAFLIVLATLGGAIYLGSIGQGWPGLGLFGLTLVAIVTAFLRSGRAEDADLSRKRRALERVTGLRTPPAHE